MLQFCACLLATDYLLQVTVQIAIFIIVIINFYTMLIGSKVFRYSIFYAHRIRICRMLNSSHNACPTFVNITVSNAVTGAPLYLQVSVNSTLADLKNNIAELYGAKYLSDIQLVFQSQVVGDDDCERRVIDLGLCEGSEIQVVRRVREEVIVVFVIGINARKPRRKVEYSFPMVVPRNHPCAALVKATVMKKFADGERSPRTNDLVQLTNPHLFLGNTDFNHASVFTLGDELCLDNCLDDFRRESSPYRVWVIDETHCRCGTCDLAWMIDGWHCPQIWDTETSGSSDDDLSMHMTMHDWSSD